MSERTWWEAKGKGAYLRVRWTLKIGTSDYSGKVNGNVNYRKPRNHGSRLIHLRACSQKAMHLGYSLYFAIADRPHGCRGKDRTYPTGEVHHREVREILKARPDRTS